MPYKDKGKDREWHREKMRERRRSVTPELLHPVTPDNVIPEKLIELRKVIKAIEPSKHIISVVPIYNPLTNKTGDKVRVQSPYSNKFIEIVVPELDAEGATLEPMGHSYELVGTSTFESNLKPVPKPLPKVKKRRYGRR